MKILVIRGGAIGDFVLTLPAVAGLRHGHPQRAGENWSAPPRSLEILGYPAIAQIAVAAGLADSARPIESQSLAGFFVPEGELDPDATRYFSEFDLIVSYLFDPSRVFQRNVERCSGARFIAAPHRPDESVKVHAAEVFLRPLAELGIHVEPQPKLTLPERADLRDRFSSAAWLAVHPGSGSESKNWPEDKWAALLWTLLATTTWNCLLVGGEAEGNRLARLASKLPTSRMELAQDLPLVELAQRLRYCAGFIGHDSGISHLAAAVGLRGVVLWGPTAQEIWRPVSGNVIILQGENLRDLAVQRVVKELREHMQS